MASLKLKGQHKLHWSDESDERRRKITQAVAQLDPIVVLVAHLSDPQRKTECFRRLCLERAYTELHQMQITQAVLESRTPDQNKKDIAHLVSLQGKGILTGLRIRHQPGGEEPLLWISDIVLGAYNAYRRDGDSRYLSILENSIKSQIFTAQSKPTGHLESL